MNFESMSSEELLAKRIEIYEQLNQQLILGIDLQNSSDDFYYVTPYPLSQYRRWYKFAAEFVENVQIINSENIKGIIIVAALFQLKSPSLTSLLASIFRDESLVKHLDSSVYIDSSVYRFSSELSLGSLSRSFVFYAPPLIFCPWVVVASHGGRITFNISFEPQGDTQIQAQVRYFEYDNLPRVERDILSGTSITTSNSFANFEMRFKGIPTGSAVNVSIEP